MPSLLHNQNPVMNFNVFIFFIFPEKVGYQQGWGLGTTDIAHLNTSICCVRIRLFQPHTPSTPSAPKANSWTKSRKSSNTSSLMCFSRFFQEQDQCTWQGVGVWGWNSWYFFINYLYITWGQYLIAGTAPSLSQRTICKSSKYSIQVADPPRPDGWPPETSRLPPRDQIPRIGISTQPVAG